MSIDDLVGIDANGFFYADYPSFLAWLTGVYQTIYGADVYLGADSQDGQFLAILAQAFFDTAAVGSSVYNSFSPVTAQGIGLSRNVKINGLNRRIPTNSTVDLTIVGVAGTTIVNGQAIDILNQKWDLPASVVIPGGGTITITATSDTLGAINADPGTITTIFTPTLGWQTVTNASAATPGEPVETDAQLRVRQAESTADPSLTVLEGTQGGIANLPGVTAVKVYENDTNSTDANTLPPHSISAVVAGGDAVEIAQEILLHKTPGCFTYGTTSEVVFDSHGMPSTIRFYRPDVATIGVEIVITTLQGWSSDYEALISEAVAAYINANGIGNTIQYTQLFVSAYLVGTAAGQTFDIVSIEINKNAGMFAAANVTLDFNEIPNCDPLTDVSITT